MTPSDRGRITSPSALTIVSIALNAPGPVAVARLVAAGATAIKIEPPWGDPLEGISKSWYDALHAGMRIERLDLKTPQGVATLKRLLALADVFIACHRPRALARLGLDHVSLLREFPALRHLNIVGDTARPDEAGHDLTYLAKAGLLTGGMPATLLADMAGAERAYAAVLELMLDAPGSSCIVGLFDTVNEVAAPLRHGLTTPGGPLGGGNPAYAVYEAREGRVAIAALEPHFRARLYDALGLADGSDLSAAMRARTAAEWERWAVDRDIPLAAVNASHRNTETRKHGNPPSTRHADLLATAHRLASNYLDDVSTRHVGGLATRADLLASLGGPLPSGSADPVDVINQLVKNADPGIVASTGPRYFGFVTGGAVPVTVAADWLASTWDQNACLYVMSPAVAVIEDIVAAWVIELLGLPRAASVGFVSGCHMANFACLAAARHEVLRRAGWNVETQGLQRAPPVRVFAGGEVHVSAVGALRFLGFGSEEVQSVPVDGQGRMRADALEALLGAGEGPTIVCAQAGNVSTGASDPIGAIVSLAHARQAWVHVDGAFGLWANAVPDLRSQVAGIAGADSWATDAHKWLNVPYDSGLAIVADAAPHRAAMSLKASYLQRGADEERIGMDWVPESSRRARVIPLYALIRSLGRDGIVSLISRNCALARRMAARLSQAPDVRILNEVVLNQVLVQFGGGNGHDADAITTDVIARVQAEGTCWAGGAVWQGKQAMRIAVSNWSTTETDIDRSADAILACHVQATETQRHRED